MAVSRWPAWYAAAAAQCLTLTGRCMVLPVLRLALHRQATIIDGFTPYSKHVPHTGR